MIRLLALLPAIPLAVACTTSPAPTVAPQSRVTAPSPSRTISPPNGAVRAAAWPAPDNHLTPGAVVACTMPRPHSERNVTRATERAVIHAYDYLGKVGEYDHRVPFSLCGANDASNVWPERSDGYRGPFQLNRKDQLEDKVIRLVHSGALTLAEGQALFMAPRDWRAEWCAYVGSPGVDCATFHP